MSIDERLEALIKTLKLYSSRHVTAEKQAAELRTTMEAQNAEMVANRAGLRAEHRENQRLLVKIHEDIRDAVIRLSNIPGAHDERRLEKRLRP